MIPVDPSEQSSLVNTYTDPYVQSVTIGPNTYTVTLLPWSPPGPPVDSAMGAIQAYVTVAPTGKGLASVIIPGGAKTGRAVQGTVSLNGPAPFGGATVQLVSAAPAALAVQPTVFVPQGATSATFLGSAIVSNAGVQVQALWNGSTVSQAVPITGGVCWDVDGNGVLNVLDAARLLRGAAGLDALPPC